MFEKLWNKKQGWQWSITEKKWSTESKALKLQYSKLTVSRTDVLYKKLIFDKKEKRKKENQQIYSLAYNSKVQYIWYKP